MHRTSSHVIEPAYPGVNEHIVPLGSCWNINDLRSKSEEIRSLFDSKKDFCKRYYRFLEAAASFIFDNYRLCTEFVDLKKITNYAIRFTNKNLRSIPDKTGKEYKRFLSAITADGIVFFEQTAKAMCNNVIILNDNYGVVSHNLLSAICSRACERGYDVISCINPLNPDKIDHIIIPEADIAILTNNKFNPVTITPSRSIHSTRFTDVDGLKQYKKRFAQNNRFTNQMLSKAQSLMLEARCAHDKLENIYTPTVDFTKVDNLFNKVIDNLIIKF